MDLLIQIAAGVLTSYLLLLIAFFAARPRGASLAEVLRLLPDLVRLLRRLAGDPEVPRGARVRLWLLLAYLALPFDLVPDFVPVLGYADDAIVVALVLRAVVRRAGPAVIRRHWSGSERGLAAVRRVAGIADAGHFTPSRRSAGPDTGADDPRSEQRAASGEVTHGRREGLRIDGREPGPAGRRADVGVLVDPREPGEVKDRRFSAPGCAVKSTKSALRGGERAAT